MGAAKRSQAIGAGLVNLELCPPTGDAELNGRGILGFYSKNRPEWVLAEQGCYGQSVIPVPLYDTLGADAVAYVVNQTSLSTVLCSEEVVENVFTCKASCATL